MAVAARVTGVPHQLSQLLRVGIFFFGAKTHGRAMPKLDIKQISHFTERERERESMAREFYLKNPTPPGAAHAA